MGHPEDKAEDRPSCEATRLEIEAKRLPGTRSSLPARRRG